MITDDLRARFFNSFEVSPCGCWLWRSGRRYGSFYMHGRRVPAHRAALKVIKGIDVPPGLCVLHACDVPRCVNPDHLTVGTHAENMADMAAKGRARAPRGGDHWTRKTPERLARGKKNGKHGRNKGTDNGNAKLSGAAVSEIRKRAAAGESDTSLAAFFGVARGAIWAIKTGKNWGQA